MVVVGLTWASYGVPPDPRFPHLQDGANGGVRIKGVQLTNMLSSLSRAASASPGLL